MRLVKDSSWCRRGVTLLWGPGSLVEVARPEEVLSIREFFALTRQFPDELPSGGGNSLVVCGVDGCLDALSPEDAETWVETDLRRAILAFEGAFDASAALVFWLQD